MSIRRAEDISFIGKHKRTDRIVLIEEGFHYRTREGELRGPFATQSLAKFDLNNFIEALSIEQQLQQS